VPQIEVTFEIDANGLMKVSAQDKATGKGEEIVITNNRDRLSPEDIERMVREAEEFADEDAAVKKRVEALNALQNSVYGLKSQLADAEGLGGKLEEADKKTLLAEIKEIQEWADANSSDATAEDFEEKLAQFQAVVSPITSKLYSGGGGSADQESWGHADGEL
jgi:heat shock protein 5